MTPSLEMKLLKLARWMDDHVDLSDGDMDMDEYCDQMGEAADLLDDPEVADWMKSHEGTELAPGRTQ